MSFRADYSPVDYSAPNRNLEIFSARSMQLPPLIYFEVRKRCFHFRLIFHGDRCSVRRIFLDLSRDVFFLFFIAPPS